MNRTDILAEAEKHLKRNGNHLPTILVSFKHVPTVIRQTLFVFPGTPEQRQHTLFLQGKQMAESWGDHKVQYVWFITEAWMSSWTRQAPRVAPSQDPKRREVLLVFELDVTTEEITQRFEVREMHQDRKKKLKALTPLPELSEEHPTPYSVLVLTFLEGFATATSSPQAYGNLQKKILEEKLKLLSL